MIRFFAFLVLHSVRIAQCVEGLKRAFVAQTAKSAVSQTASRRVVRSGSGVGGTPPWRVGNPRYGRLATGATLVAAPPRCVAMRPRPSVAPWGWR